LLIAYPLAIALRARRRELAEAVTPAAGELAGDTGIA